MRNFNTKFKMYTLVTKYINNNLDIIHYIKKNQDLYFMKSLLFSETQLSELNKLNKINLNNPQHFKILGEEPEGILRKNNDLSENSTETKLKRLLNEL